MIIPKSLKGFDDQQKNKKITFIYTLYYTIMQLLHWTWWSTKKKILKITFILHNYIGHCLEAFWRIFEEFWRHFRGVSEAFLRCFGSISEAFEAFWRHFGLVLEVVQRHFWGIWRHFWEVWEALERCSRRILKVFQSRFRGISEHFGGILDVF